MPSDHTGLTLTGTPLRIDIEAIGSAAFSSVRSLKLTPF